MNIRLQADGLIGDSTVHVRVRPNHIYQKENNFYSTFGCKLPTTRFILVVQLLITLLMPRVQQSLHGIQDHDVHECDADSTHMHKIIHSCDECDVFTHILAYNFNSNTIQSDRPAHYTFWMAYFDVLIENHFIYSDLRAPPVVFNFA